MKKENFEIDLLEEKNILRNSLLTIASACKSTGENEIRVEQCNDALYEQLNKLCSIIKSLKIENHNLKDKVIQLGG